MKRWSRQFRFRREACSKSTEAGVAIMEFVICLPFMILVVTAMIDIAFLLNQYLSLTHAVHAGVRIAATYPQIEPGTFTGLSSGQGCSASGNAVFHSKVQSRIEDVLQQYIPTSHLDPTTLCITTEARVGAGAWSGTPQDRTVRVRVNANYRGFFPVLNGLQITVESNGPALSS